MTLVIGGAYQGKLDWVLNDLGAECNEVYACRHDSTNIDLTSTIIDNLHLYLLALIREGCDPLAVIEPMLCLLEGKTIIIEDITAGVVPVDGEMRAWREAVGRVMGLLSSKAKRVVRVFCGIAVTLK